MADNVLLNAGSGGKTVAALDSTGVYFQQVILHDGTTAVVVDADLGALSTIGELHRKIHQGKAFRSCYRASILDDAFLIMRMTTGATKEQHLTVSASCGVEAFVDIYEGTTFTTPGSAITPINLNRRSATAAEATVYTGSTVNAAGTTLESIYLPGSDKIKNGSGSSAGGRDEYELAASTEYAFVVQNKGSATANAALCLTWYELG